MAPKTPVTKLLTAKEYEQGILGCNRVVLGQAITLIESSRGQDRAKAENLIEKLSTKTGRSIRIGITGVPGVGKSTFIEVFGKYLTALHKKVAVLAVDPSSQKTKGSILGDKTRMEELSKDTNAFIRPTSTGSALGGVANATRQAILLCEAAGFDVVLVETVGVGQSEVAVRGMVDFFLLLMLAGAGDELQGIKKGIMEMADGIVITKADGENIKKAKQAQADFQHALHWFQAPESGWAPKVLTNSAFTKTGIAEIWEIIESFERQVRSNGFLLRQRDRQRVEWFHQNLDALIKEKITKRSKNSLSSLENKVMSNQLSPGKAAREFLKKLRD
jgi:LAO/AO transport system kinase